MRYLWNLLTFPSSAYTIVPVFLWGLLKGRRKVFLLSLIIFFLSSFLNVFLKEFFQVPLNPVLKLTHTYGFPSGHIQNTYVLWGILAVYYNKTWLVFLVIIMGILNGIAVYALGFHTVLDIAGAYYVAFVLILLTSIIIPKKNFLSRSFFWKR